MLGEDPDEPYTYASVHFFASRTHELCGDLALAEEVYRKGVDFYVERGFTKVVAETKAELARLSSLRAQTQNSQEKLSKTLEILAESEGSLERVPQHAVDLARIYALAGKPDAAFSTLERGLEVARRSGVEVDLAMMYLLKGSLFESKSNRGEAEKSFRTSIETARRQSAKSMELRATTSLARLLRDTGRRDEARAMLAEIYNWFTEGFDTADLKDAKTLLDELNQDQAG
jgi:tetratricopeptide (TPR) repeat protein